MLAYVLDDSNNELEEVQCHISKVILHSLLKCLDRYATSFDYLVICVSVENIVVNRDNSFTIFGNSLLVHKKRDIRPNEVEPVYVTNAISIPDLVKTILIGEVAEGAECLIRGDESDEPIRSHIFRTCENS
ncbi:unnamed protein product [Acanthocheilonema viteae]|uniref:Uncharacterized protein n=1 Tax=Acanthocheilonema viteae TaxID=6277 RepID=A0A498SW80_ACAVI|nr:unnamed protein product [Acanthocheilonema viteae]